MLEFSREGAGFRMRHLQEIGEKSEVAPAGHRRKLGRNLRDIMGDFLWGRVKSAVCSGRCAPGNGRRFHMSDKLLASRSRCVFCERSHNPSRPECRTKACICRSRRRQRIMQSYSCIFRYKLESLVSDFAREVGASYRYFGHAAVAAQEREPMPKIMHGKLAGSVLSGLALIVVTAACQARAESSPLAQEVVVASRNSPAGVGQFHALHHQMRRERVVRRHFRGPRVIGIENGVVGVPVPVPQESDEAYPLEPSSAGMVTGLSRHRLLWPRRKSSPCPRPGRRCAMSCPARQALPPPFDAGKSWWCVDARRPST